MQARIDITINIMLWKLIIIPCFSKQIESASKAT